MLRFDSAARWILSPTLNAASVPPLFLAGVLLVAILVERTLGYVRVFAGLLALLVIDVLVFGLLSVGLARLERLRLPGILDHLRHCAMLYAGMVLLGSYLVYEELKPWPCCSLAWSMGALLFLVAAYAVVLNASVVYVTQRRSA